MPIYGHIFQHVLDQKWLRWRINKEDRLLTKKLPVSLLKQSLDSNGIRHEKACEI